MKKILFLMLFLTMMSFAYVNISSCTNLTSAGEYRLNSSILNSTISNCIKINSSNVALDCQNNLIDGNDIAEYGITNSWTTKTNSNITIKNCILTDWDTAAINLRNNNATNLYNITLTSNPDYGIYSSGDDRNTYTNVTANNNYIGIMTSSASGTIINSTFEDNSYGGGYFSQSSFGLNNVKSQDNTRIDVAVIAFKSNQCVYNFTDVAGTGNLAIVFYNTSVNINNWDRNASEIILCGTNRVNITNVTLSMNAPLPGGLFLSFANNTVITNTTINNTYFGTFISRSYSTTYNNYNATNGYYGLRVGSFSEGIIVNNSIFSDQAYSGIYADSTTNALLVVNSNFTDISSYPINLQSVGSNISIYNNYFNNIAVINIASGFSAYLNTTNKSGTNIIGGPYTGGNAWANPSSSGYSQTCADANDDGYCDVAYTPVTGGTDYLPLAIPDVTEPQGSILSPNNNTVVNGNITIIANATDDRGIDYVEIQWRNSTSPTYTAFTGCNHLTTFPYTCVWDTVSYVEDAEGYEVRVYPCDYSGNCNNDTIQYNYTIDRTIPHDDLNIVYPLSTTKLIPIVQTSVRDSQLMKYFINVTDGNISAGINTSIMDLTLLNGSGNTSMIFSSGSLAPDEWSYWNLSVVISGASTGYLTPNLYVFDNASPLNNLMETTLPTNIDNEAPTHSGEIAIPPIIYNATNVTFYITLTDNYQIGSYRFSTNISGIWVNTTWDSTDPIVSMNYTETVYTGHYGYQWYYWDDAGNQNTTGIIEFDVLGNATTLDVFLFSPLNNTNVTTTPTELRAYYVGVDASDCVFYVNFTPRFTILSPPKISLFSAFVPLSAGSYSWYVSCAELIGGTVHNSPIWYFNVTTNSVSNVSLVYTSYIRYNNYNTSTNTITTANSGNYVVNYITGADLQVYNIQLQTISQTFANILPITSMVAIIILVGSLLLLYSGGLSGRS